MPKVFLMSRWLVEGSRKIAGQVIVSLCATALVAAISPSFFKEATPSAAPTGDHRVSDLEAASLLRSGFQPGMAGARAYRATEFESLAPLSVPSVLPATPAVVVVREVAPPAPKLVRKPATASAPQGCTGECSPLTVATVLPPARPLDHETPSNASLQIGEAKPERARLLGMPLPEFVPTGEAILRSGAVAVGSVYSLGATVVQSAANVMR